MRLTRQDAETPIPFTARQYLHCPLFFFKSFTPPRLSQGSSKGWNLGPLDTEVLYSTGSFGEIAGKMAETHDGQKKLDVNRAKLEAEQKGKTWQRHHFLPFHVTGLLNNHLRYST